MARLDAPHLTNRGQPWTYDDDTALQLGWHTGRRVDRPQAAIVQGLARLLKRSVRAVRERLRKVLG